jgi:AcrR family transcriptional regulator
VRTAGRILEEEGLEAVSMRRLSGELGAGTMTLYGHFRDKDELLDAIVDARAGAAPPPRLRGDWTQRLRQIFGHLHRNLSEHPGLVELRIRRPIATPGAFVITELGMRTLRDAGFPPAEAARAFRTLFVFTFGAAAFSPPGRAPQARSTVLAAVGALAPEEYPTLAAMGTELADSLDPRGEFETGLEHILDGLKAALAREAWAR